MNKVFEKWARALITEYQKKLLITQHHVTLEGKTESDSALMQIKFRLPYLDPLMGYNPKKVEEYWKKGDKAELKHSIVHELCHIVTDPLYGCAVDRHISKDETERTRETLTDHIAMIVMKNDL